jgi:hypothetical protein
VINDHYNEFVRTNKKGKCPYCGLNDIDGEYVHTREAYDHYLPKSTYPFCSINFKNLAPICHKCNSGNKGSKDPLHDANGNRRKSFYSYNTLPYNIEIKIDINTSNIENLRPENIQLDFGPSNLSQEIQTWKKLFGIEERYKAKCCDADAKHWIVQVAEECQNYGLSPQAFLQAKLREAAHSPFHDLNFLRKPFLEGCDKIHLFD